ncbi:MAG TPA: S41 family peptidase [Pseudomonadales bacterium]|nr:S41 family peptidase [Pseudomonadales bacterium]
MLVLLTSLTLAPMAQAAPAARPDADAPLVSAEASAVDAPAAPGAAADPGVLPLDDLRAFVEVMDRIRSSYVDEVDDRTLLESAIRGMLESLDPHSSYLAHDDYADLQEATTGSFGGVGIEIGFEDGQLRVISPLDGTPADRAGVLAGDIIIELDANPVEAMSLAEAIDSMRGEPGTAVSLTVMRDGAEAPLEFDLVRDVIEVASVRHRMLEPGFGYIRISQFQDRTGLDLEEALDALEEAAATPMNGLVLDLRNNPGGLLQASVQVADAFLSRGRIVYTEGRLPGAEVSYNATATDRSHGVPLVVLVNEGSASAAEIVAGALQDQRRAVVMGTPSFGKGSVQTVLPLSGERAIKLTTALYYTPNGRSIQAQGIIPDITVERATVKPTTPGAGYRESDLPGHLDNRTGDAASAAPASALASDDYQLAEALNLLKGMHLLSMRARDE